MIYQVNAQANKSIFLLHETPTRGIIPDDPCGVSANNPAAHLEAHQSTNSNCWFNKSAIILHRYASTMHPQIIHTVLAFLFIIAVWYRSIYEIQISNQCRSSRGMWSKLDIRHWTLDIRMIIIQYPGNFTFPSSCNMLSTDNAYGDLPVIYHTLDHFLCTCSWWGSQNKHCQQLDPVRMNTYLTCIREFITDGLCYRVTTCVCLGRNIVFNSIHIAYVRFVLPK